MQRRIEARGRIILTEGLKDSKRIIDLNGTIPVFRCFTCNEKGHFAKDCPRNKGSSKENENKRNHDHNDEYDDLEKKKTREDSSSDEEYVLWSRRIQPMIKNNFLSITTLDKKGCTCNWWRRRDTQIHDMEDLLNIVNHEQYKHMSLELDDDKKKIFKESIYSCKETRMKRESTHQTNKDKCLNCHFLYI